MKIEPKAVWHVFGTCNRAVLLGLAVATLAIILYSKSIADGAGFSRAVLLCAQRMAPGKDIAAKGAGETNY